MNRLYGIFDRTDDHSFQIIHDETVYSKKDIEEKIEFLESEFKLIIQDIPSRRIYIDIKDRFIFTVLFLTLKKLNAAVVLIPIEIKPDVFFEPGIVYISDTKHFASGLFISYSGTEFEILVNDEFSPDSLSKFENKHDLYLFTSGSTGKSKLIGKTAGNIITEAMELYRLFKPGKKDVFYYTAPLYHIYGFLFGLILPLYASSKIDMTYHFSPDSIAEYVKEQRIDYFVSIPSYYKMADDLRLHQYFKKVKKLFSSSAPLPLDVSEAFYKSGVSIEEIYGSTETGGIAYRVSAVNISWNLFSYVSLKEHSLTSDIELCIDSPAISVDYDKDTGYNTGDVVSFSSMTDFVLLGRNTRFVKIHGKRVDLGFVTSRIIEYFKTVHGILCREDDLYAGVVDEKIFIITDKKPDIEVKDIIENLKQYLPGYAIPRYYIFQEIPRNQMGKINKAAIDLLVKGGI